MNPRWAAALFLTLASALCFGCTGSGHGSSPSRTYLVICEGSSAQQAASQDQIERLMAAVRSGTRYGPTHRYIALLTLNPNQTQVDAYLRRRAETEAAEAAQRRKLSRNWVDPSRLRCLMVWDTESKTFVNRNCYLVGSLPAVGSATTFDDVTAEFVGPQ
jgi:hypothetical protein